MLLSGTSVKNDVVEQTLYFHGSDKATFCSNFCNLIRDSLSLREIKVLIIQYVIFDNFQPVAQIFAAKVG